MVLLAGACNDDEGGSPPGAAGAGVGGDDPGNSAGQPTLGAGSHSGGSPHGGETLGGAAGDTSHGGAPAPGGGAGGTDASGGGAGAGMNESGGAAGAGGAAHTQLQWLGKCTPRGFSKDGSTVLADEGIWTAETGWQALPDLPGGASSNMPRALSQDGKVVFGNSASALGDEMYRWTTAAGIQPLGVTYVPFAASLDGSAAVGWTTDNSELDAQPFRWTSGGAFATLGPFADTLSITNFIDAQLNDAGDVAQFSFDRDVARWSPGSGLEPHPNAIRATAISADGSQVAYFYAHGDGDYGSTDACLPAHAYDDPSSGFVKDECAYQGMWVAIFDLDDTGTVGVGFQLDEDNDYVAFYWTKDLGMSRLDRLLPAGVKSYPQAQASEWFAESYPPHPYISGDGQLVLAQAAAGECFVARIVGL